MQFSSIRLFTSVGVMQKVWFFILSFLFCTLVSIVCIVNVLSAIFLFSTPSLRLVRFFGKCSIHSMHSILIFLYPFSAVHVVHSAIPAWRRLMSSPIIVWPTLVGWTAKLNIILYPCVIFISLSLLLWLCKTHFKILTQNSSLWCSVGFNPSVCPSLRQHPAYLHFLSNFHPISISFLSNSLLIPSRFT